MTDRRHDDTLRPATHASYRGDHATARPDSIVQGEHYRFTVLTDALVRLEWSADGAFDDRPTTLALHRDLPTPEFSLARSDRGVRITTAAFDLTYDEREFSAAGLQVALRHPVGAHSSVWRYRGATTVPADATVPAVVVPRRGNLGGTARTLDEANGAVPLEDGLAAEQGFAVLDDSHSMAFTADGWFEPRQAPRADYEDLYLFTHGYDFAGAVADFYRLSGTQPVLPRWALGNWWSRYHRYSADSYLALLDEFERRELPFSVAVIDMDWHITTPELRFGNGWTGYTWNRELFPEPEAFLTELHRRGLHATLNVHPADGIRAFEDAYPAVAERLGVDPATEQSILFDPTDREFMDAYFELVHHPLEDEGVDFWWLDWQSGPHSRVPGVDPLWVLNHLHYLDSTRPGREPLTFSRYAGPGSHRYPVGFSGDTIISWESLAYQPYFTSTAANIGYGWWSHDIGGHMFGYRDDELALRWVQFGVFSPILRLHSSDSPFSSKESWTFEEPYATGMADALRFRARLVPYLHSMNIELAERGAPLVRPMYFGGEGGWGDLQAVNAYHFGTQLVVAAITEPINEATRRARVDMFLPAGDWYDVFTGLRYQGGRNLALHRGLASIPVFLRAGGFLPLAPHDAPAAENPSTLEIIVGAGGSGSFDLFEDAGVPGENVAATRFEIDHEQQRLVVHAVTGEADSAPASRDVTFTVLGAADLTEVELSGSGHLVGVERVDATRQRVTVTGIERSVGATLLAPGLSGRAANPATERVHEVLTTARIANLLKEALAREIGRQGISALASLPAENANFPFWADDPRARVSPELAGVLTELLLADPN